MKDKTAIQEFKEYLESKEYNYLNPALMEFAIDINKKATELLEKEKQQIIDSCVNCIKEGVEGEGVLTFNETDEKIVRKNISDYYDKTYE